MRLRLPDIAAWERQGGLWEVDGDTLHPYLRAIMAATMMGSVISLALYPGATSKVEQVTEKDLAEQALAFADAILARIEAKS